MEKRIAIIGGGIAGLAAGCYGRMNGFRTEIIEAHNLPGGLCTSWQRQGFTVDGSIHWLVGSAPPTDFHTFWRELGVFPGTHIADHEARARFQARDGRSFTLWTDAGRLERHLIELSPADAPLARELCGQIRLLSRMKPPLAKAFELMGPLDIVRLIAGMARFLKPLGAAAAVRIGEWACRWRDPLLSAAWPQLLQHPAWSLQSLLVTLADMHRRAAGFPVGGSLALARSIERRYRELGGEIRYRAPVTRVLVENGRAAGVELADGTRVPADVVFSAADLRHTLDDLLGGKFREPQHEELFRDVPIMPSGLLITLGLQGAFGEEASSTSYELPAEVTMGGEPLRWLAVRNFNHDPSLSLPGCSMLQLLLPADYHWWAQKAGDREAYQAEKQRAVETVVTELERFHPGLRGRLLMSDVATPLTFERYTRSWQGSYMTWIHDAATQNRFRVICKTLPGLSGFYLCGMWVMAPGGVPAAAKTARDVVQMLCKAEGRRFTTTFA